MRTSITVTLRLKHIVVALLGSTLLFGVYRIGFNRGVDSMAAPPPGITLGPPVDDPYAALVQPAPKTAPTIQVNGQVDCYLIDGFVNPDPADVARCKKEKARQ